MKTRSTILAALLTLGAGVASAHAAPAYKRSAPSAEAQKNKKAGEEFLAKNKAKEGVVTLGSGLQYKILQASDGKKPTLLDTVVVHYRGTLIDGTEFGNSYKTGRPGTFPLRAAIAGWREAMQLMPAGSKWQLFVPPHLAYGERGGGRAIAPNETLVFEAELIAVQEGVANAASPAAVTGIEVSFKLDPRLTRSLYLGDRWVSPATFTAPPQGKTSTVEASASGIDAAGRRVDIDAKWMPADPAMVSVAKAQGKHVSITVKHPGETTLKVVFGGIAKELLVKASKRGDGFSVQISQ